jgi:hypothetical protein
MREMSGRNARLLSLAGAKSCIAVAHDSAAVPCERVLPQAPRGDSIGSPAAPRKDRRDSGSSLRRHNRQRRQEEARNTSKDIRLDVPRTSRFTFSSLSSPPAWVEDTMGEFSLAPFWALLKIELHRLVRRLRRRCGAADFTRPWQLAQMEFDTSIQGPSIGRVVRSNGIFNPPPDSD